MSRHARHWIFLVLLISLSMLSARAASFLPRPKACLLDIQPNESLSQPVVLSKTSSAATVLSLRGGEVSEIAMAAYEWCVNLGNPSALVAGAVIATIYENISSGTLEIKKDDHPHVKFAKRLTRVLLLSAFALEVMSIFVTTVTGTMLMSKTEDALDAMVEVTKDTTPLSFLRHNFEFEYLTARITFLQGLLNWLMAIALGHLIPGDESMETRLLNKFVGRALFLTIFLMLAFYNNHMNFYPNYFFMLSRWVQVSVKQFILQWPPRPSVLLTIPCFVMTLSAGYEAFQNDHKKDKSSDTVVVK